MPNPPTANTMPDPSDPETVKVSGADDRPGVDDRSGASNRSGASDRPSTSDRSGASDRPSASDRPGVDGITRRGFLSTASAATACALLATEGRSGAAGQPLGPPPPGLPVAPTPAPSLPGPGEIAVKLRVNEVERVLNLDPRVTLLDALRENLQLTGAKKGCDHGQCGACTVLVDGRRIYACLTLAAMNDGSAVTTIEGLGRPGALHPLQAAFIEHDALQCGYCTPGQIVSAVGLLGEPGGVTDADVQKGLCGNLCRCGAYPNIVAAVQKVRAAAPARK